MCARGGVGRCVCVVVGGGGITRCRCGYRVGVGRCE